MNLAPTDHRRLSGHDAVVDAAGHDHVAAQRGHAVRQVLLLGGRVRQSQRHDQLHRHGRDYGSIPAVSADDDANDGSLVLLGADRHCFHLDEECQHRSGETL